MVALATAYNARETERGTTRQELLHFVEEVSGIQWNPSNRDTLGTQYKRPD